MLTNVFAAAALAWCFDSPPPHGVTMFHPGVSEGHKWGIVTMKNLHDPAVVAIPCLDQEGPNAAHIVTLYLKKNRVDCTAGKSKWDPKDGGWLVGLRCPVNRTHSN